MSSERGGNKLYGEERIHIIAESCVCVVVMCVRARQGNREKKTYIKSLNYLICVCERKRKRESESKIDRERERERERKSKREREGRA